MKTARWLTMLGSLALIATAIFHTAGYASLLRRVDAAAIRPPLDGLLKAFWLAFSVECLALAAIALFARGMVHGGRIVLVCAACAGLTCLLFLRFLGLFPGVYLLAVITALLLLGGWLQTQNTA